MTDRYAVIGNPVAHSRSPWIHAAFAHACGQDLEYGRIEAPLERFEAAVREFRAAGGRGLNVTVPFKEEAFRLCQRSSPRARTAQVVNTLVIGEDIFGDTTDGPGLVADLTRNLGLALSGKTVLLLGAGGAARGVAGSLLDAGVARLVIANRTVARARSLAARFPGSVACGFDELGAERFDIVVNATSSGLAGEALPLPRSLMAEGVLAYDMVYGRETPFLQSARAAGARASDGLGMLVEQAAESFLLWRGVRPETRSVLERLRAA